MTERDRRLADHLARFVSDHKRNFISRVLDDRTNYITVVLENIYQSQNASAVLRTAECMGLQDVHIVENTAKYQLNVRVLKGSDKWLRLHRYNQKGVNNTEACFEGLRREGYRIFVADPADDGVPFDSIDLAAGKLALVFGNELRGASDFALQQADCKVCIPMYGFTESLNVSVSVAICLSALTKKLRSSDIDFSLTQEEKDRLLLAWYKKVVRRSDVLTREFLRTIE